MTRRFAAPVAALVLLGIGESSAQTATCEPGPVTLLGASDVVVRAKPLRARLHSADGMYYLRGDYEVIDTARGDAAGTVTVEVSCIDMPNPATDEADLGHCPGAAGIGLPGFTPTEDAVVAAGETILYLSRTSTSPLDEASVHGAVDRRPFRQCDDRPREFSSTEEAWSYVEAKARGAAPSSPLADYDREVAESRENQRNKASRGCR